MKLTSEERKASRLLAAKKWRDANRDKHRQAVARCRQRPEAKEAHRKRQLEYAQRNREQERLRVAEWRKENPERARQLDRRQYLKDPSAVMEYNRQYRTRNRERVSIWGRNRKARKRANGGQISPGFVEILLVLQGEKCPTCSAEFSATGYHVDHVVPLSKGGLHCDSNVILLCPTCNKRKSARSLSAFLSILEAEKCAM